jgi:lipoprotein-releasing system permease protein
LFLYNASYLILRGLVIGNAIGISLLLLQKYFGIIRLDPETYYVDTAPVYLTLWHVFFLNLGTLLLCLLMLLLPSYLITRVRPSKAVKFE